MQLRIKEICKEKGVLFKDLAAEIGVSDIALRASLKGNPTLSTLQKIATALNVEIWELFTDSIKKTDLYGFVKYKANIHEIDSIDALEKLLSEVRGSQGEEGK